MTRDSSKCNQCKYEVYEFNSGFARTTSAAEDLE